MPRPDLRPLSPAGGARQLAGVSISSRSSAPGAVGAGVREQPLPGPVPLLVHPDWADRFPWLLQGTTARGGEGDSFDLRLFGPAAAGGILTRWQLLLDALGFPGAVHSRQVHGVRVHLHGESHDGLRLASAADGHATRVPGLLLTVGTADCVPAFLVHPASRSVALLHAGWRGVAAGILEQGVRALRDRLGVSPEGLLLHLGPAICGEGYEVGPEVHEALGAPVPGGAEVVDLRAVLSRRGREAGIPESGITWSTHCTRCGPPTFFSHRRGDTGRQLGVLGIRDTPGAPA